MTCVSEFVTIVQGEDRSIQARIIQQNYLPFSLVGATGIRVRFKKSNGSYIEKTMLDGSVVVVDAELGQMSVALNSNDTSQLLVGDRQDFSIIVDKGVRASVVVAAATIQANVPGIEMNGTSILFDGIKTIAQTVAALPVTVIGNGAVVPTSQTVTLSGGTSDRRKVNFKRALTVEKEMV